LSPPLSVLWLAHEVLLPFVLGGVVAYVVLPLVQKLEKRGLKRGVAIVFVYACILGTLGLFLRLAVPRVSKEIVGFRRELPRITRELQDQVVPSIQGKLASFGIGSAVEPQEEPLPGAVGAPAASASEPAEHEPTVLIRPRKDGSLGVELTRDVTIRPTEDGAYVITDPVDTREGTAVSHAITDLPKKALGYVRKNMAELLKGAQVALKAVSRGIFMFSLTLMIAAYLMLTKEKIFGFFTSLVAPAGRESFDKLLTRMDKGLSGVVRGQLVICLINGALTAVGYAMIGLKYWPVLALVATVFSLIPIFGAIVSSVPAVIIGLTQGVGTAAFVLMWIVVIHQLEANFLNPKIMGDAAKIHPVLVIFSLLVGEHMFHTAGALLAVPCMSIAQSLFSHFWERIQQNDPAFEGEPAVEETAPVSKAVPELPKRG
jgi:predicted PurR-regulated permease PerM